MGMGGEIISTDEDLKHTTTWDYVVGNYEDNSMRFDSDRAGIFHHMIAVHDLKEDGDRYCGFAQYPGGGDSSDPDNRGDFSVLAHGEHTDDSAEAGTSCTTGSDLTTAIRDTVLQEFGHHSFDEIEPDGDKCNFGHDIYEDYSMATGYCGAENYRADYWGGDGDNRWYELQNPLGQNHDPSNPDSTDDEEWNNDRDSVGDLNNGVQGE